MGYLKIARELLNSSFWRSLAPAEKGILTDLMAMAAYKPTTYNLYGTEIELHKYELCFSTKILADKWNISVHVLRKIIEKLTRNNLAVKKRRQIDKTENNTGDNSRRGKNNNPFFLSLTFNRWVFEDDSDDVVYTQKIRPETTPNFSSGAEHNKEVLKKEVLNENIKKNSACAEPSFESSKSLPYKKTWYSMEEIAELNFAYADEIMADWKEYSGRSEKEVREKLSLFAKKKLRVGQSKMTLDVFDKEFRKEMKSAFALKSKQKNEPERELYYYGEDD